MRYSSDILDPAGNVFHGFDYDLQVWVARRGLAFVRHCRDHATAYERNGHTLHLGHYAIDSVDAEGNLRAGCHSITIDEIERIAPELEAK